MQWFDLFGSFSQSTKNYPKMPTLHQADVLETESLIRENAEVNALMLSLSDWIEVILKFEGLLNWENPRLLFGCMFLITLIFALFHQFNPPVLATLGYGGLILSFVDYFGPMLSARLSIEVPPSEVTRRYREFCRRLVHARHLFIDFVRFLYSLRSRHVIIYFVTSFGLIFIFGFIGLHMTGLLFSYLLTMICLITPGIRYNNVHRMITYPLGVAVRVIRTCLWNPMHKLPRLPQLFRRKNMAKEN